MSQAVNESALRPPWSQRCGEEQKNRHALTTNPEAAETAETMRWSQQMPGFMGKCNSPRKKKERRKRRKSPRNMRESNVQSPRWFQERG